MADTFHGGSVTLGSSGITLKIIEASYSGGSTAAIATPHAGLTTGDNIPYIPADLNEGGTLDLTVELDPDQELEGQSGVVHSITHTYAIPSGQSSAATKVFSGFIVDYSESLPIDDRITATVSIKVAGNITFTASA